MMPSRRSFMVATAAAVGATLLPRSAAAEAPAVTILGDDAQGVVAAEVHPEPMNVKIWSGDAQDAYDRFAKRVRDADTTGTLTLTEGTFGDLFLYVPEVSVVLDHCSIGQVRVACGSVTLDVAKVRELVTAGGFVTLPPITA